MAILNLAHFKPMRMSMRLVVIITLLVPLLSGFVPGFAPERIAAAGGGVYINQTAWAGVGQYRVHGQLHFDGKRAWVDWKSCDTAWATAGTWHETTWCGVYYGNGFIEIGANYTIHYTVPTPWGGVEYYHYSTYMRSRLYPSGAVSCYPYGCSYNYN